MGLIKYDALKTQYEADSKRLQLVIEGESHEENSDEMVCPFCSGRLEKSVKESCAEAASKELLKLAPKVKDLKEANESLVGNKEDTSTAYDKAFRQTSLPYSLRLKDFKIETNAADGSPTQYSAQVLVDGKLVEIAVNRPYAVSPTEDIYLMNFDSTGENGNVDLCVLMIERQPWKYPMFAGICLLLMGTAIWCININRRTDRQ